METGIFMEWLRKLDDRVSRVWRYLYVLDASGTIHCAWNSVETANDYWIETLMKRLLAIKQTGISELENNTILHSQSVQMANVAKINKYLWYGDQTWSTVKKTWATVKKKGMVLKPIIKV